MTIRRQYSLPNCTLVLEGLSDGSTSVGDQLDPRPAMTILVSAECHLAGQGQPLSGGREFFESLVTTVSRYAQEFLSQVPHPKLDRGKPTLVQLDKIETNLHRLSVVPTAEAVGAGMVKDSRSHQATVPGTMHLDLTTVQLFDLVEAIDQFLADRRTLPEVGVNITPLPKRYRQADEPVAKRAAPAALGMTSLALAAAAFFLVPIPEVRDPRPANSQPNASQTTPSDSNTEGQATATPTSPPPSPSAAELEKVLTETPEITDPTQLRFLQRGLYNKINQAWDNRREVQSNLEYRVGVGKDGAIVGYQPVDETPLESAKQTPLPDLLYIPTTGSIATSEPLAQFRVVFNRRGILQISPWRGYQGRPSLGPEITDGDAVRRLNDQLYEQLRERWSGTPTFPRALTYRVAVTQEGVIADYEPQNQPAWDYVQQTPLDNLLKPEAAGIGGEDGQALPQKPLAQFQVVFRPSGVLEVSPLRGYR